MQHEVNQNYSFFRGFLQPGERNIPETTKGNSEANWKRTSFSNLTKGALQDPRKSKEVFAKKKRENPNLLERKSSFHLSARSASIPAR